MATTMTCDHCGKPIGKDEAVRIDIMVPYRTWSSTGKGSLKDRAKAAADDAAALAKAANLYGHYDLHEQCYETTILPHLTAAIGAPS